MVYLQSTDRPFFVVALFAQAKNSFQQKSSLVFCALTDIFFSLLCTLAQVQWQEQYRGKHPCSTVPAVWGALGDALDIAVR